MMRSRDFPWMRFLPSRWVIGAATLGPVGLVKRAPGTWGSLAGLAWYALVFYYLPAAAFLLFWLLTIYLAMAVTNEAEKRLQQRDPGKIVLDEFIAIPGCFLFLRPGIEALGGWPVLLTGFLLFRVFDIWKPGIVDRFQRIPGGVGVVLDDVAAALLTCVLLHVALAIGSWGMGVFG